MMLFKCILPAPHVTGFLMAAALLSACSKTGVAPKIPLQMHLACQTIDCRCLGERPNVFSDRKIANIVWQLNGDATCPKGFSLERVRR